MKSIAVVSPLTLAAACLAQAPDWNLQKPATSPSPRFGHEIVYDSARQLSVLFGGRDATNGDFRSDTWEWNGLIWSKTSPTTTPKGRIRHAIAYDSARQRTVMFGGLAWQSILGDTWEWDGKNWNLLQPTTSPSARWDSAMAFDSFRRRTVLFGGLGGLAETWEWNGTNWTRINTSAAPSDRYGHAMAYDAARRRIVMFGGERAAFPQNAQLADTWEFDGVTWKQAQPIRSPSARHDHSMAYDSARQRVVLFGGTDNFGSLADTWEFDGNNWTSTQPAKSPSVRGEHAIAYDSARQRTMLFGGGSVLQLLGDTWEFGVSKLTLTADTPAISIATGGAQKLTLNAGVGLKNQSYWVFGSFTGTTPGVLLLGIHIPLNVDPYTDIGISAVNSTVFAQYRGTLDASGSAAASFNVPRGLPLLPITLHHSYVVYDASTGQLHTASNPVPVSLK